MAPAPPMVTVEPAPDGESPDLRQPSPFDGSEVPPPPPSLEPPDDTRTRTWGTTKPRDAVSDRNAARVVKGLLAAVLRTLGWQLGRAGLELRQPTNPQLDGIAAPAGRILARFLPAELISGTLVDVAELSAATNDYLLDGDAGTPLVARVRVAEYPEGESA